ncbi:MAG TPA: DNA topology modulation protein [Pyrinomonadaceae bacterium]|jgi:adenylate kinase family enzyme|nr:DNA topology modulation protein [Pyrinomonadaceae bacterium]
MRKVLVIGSGGSGKSTFAERLGGRTGLPVIHLDSFFWRAGWQEPPRDEWAARVDELLKRDAWIMDGNYGGTLERRLAACDTVVFLDLPRVLCLWRVVSRSLRYRGRTRPDMAEGCPEQLTWEFLRWVWTYPRRRRAGVLKRLGELGAGQKAYVLRSRREVRRFLEESGLSGKRVV